MVKHKIFGALFLAGTLLASCSRIQPAPGPIRVQLIQPTGHRCHYRPTVATVQTLTHLPTMRGQLGRVVTTKENISDRPYVLDSGALLEPVTVDFAQSSSGVYYPMDETSLRAVTHYDAVEKAHRLFSSLSPAADLSYRVQNLYDTTIILGAKYYQDKKDRTFITDNAAYVAYEQLGPGTRNVKNYFFSFPSGSNENMPLGFNLGILTHEYAHMVMQHLLYEPAYARGISVNSAVATANTLSSWEEGVGDYFGFLATKDPAYFECSFPNLGRDISVPKPLSEDLMSSLVSNEDIDPHEGGAVWASANFEIGQYIGHHNNARYIVNMMASLLDCNSAITGTNEIALDFNTIAQCHARSADPQDRMLIQSVYTRYFGDFGAYR